MNTIKSTFLLVLTCVILQSQAQNPFTHRYRSLYEPGNFSLGIGPVLLVNTGAGAPYAGTLTMQYFLGSRFCLKSDLVIGENYVHMGPGLLGIPLWMLFNSGSPSEHYFYSVTDLRDLLFEVVSFVVFTTLSFEQMSYHIPITAKSDISPSLSLLRLTIQASEGNRLMLDDEGGSHIGGAVGCRYNHYLGQVIFSPYAEYAMFYDNDVYNFNLGVTVAYLFQPRRGKFL